MRFFLAESTRAALIRLAELAEPTPAGAVPPLERLRAIRRLIHELEADPATLAGVRDSLDAGAGWDEVADAALLKPAAARWRWSGTDEEIAARAAAGRKRAARPSSVPTELPGLSVAQAAATLGVTAQAIYLKVSRGKLASRTAQLPDGRSYKRVFLDGVVPTDSKTDAYRLTEEGTTDD
ncbi:hypothetical protein QMG61_15030 [Cryobacterium sp. PH31-AA6]|uniref:hypothetical protein n=1 Tax=Cryobacterium sp. PH31-AA6 TaxID=3046205 RepID=UPI0024BA07F9|nr:hypothetical protein [Cryobacterium sp. PH31-AA6]MDJ0325077.1 hypothetical protein [Cryobacterium sp. PH31-AA6]